MSTPGFDTKSASTLSFGLTSHLHAAAQSYDAALVLNIANGYFLPLLRARGIGIVLNTDGIEWQRGKWGRAARRVFLGGAQLSARYADVLVSDSRAIGELWRERFNVAPRFIPYGADARTDIGSDRVVDLGLVPGSYVLAVARLIPENNVDITLDAVGLLTPAPPTVIVGSANYPSPLETRLETMGRQGRVHWLGHVYDQDLLTQLWANAGVYVHGHSVGGTNPALLQALAAGAPTLALDTPFNREVIGCAAQMYSLSASDLAARIRQVLATDADRSGMAARGRDTVRQRYRWNAVCDAYELALRDSIGSAHRREKPSLATPSARS